MKKWFLCFILFPMQLIAQPEVVKVTTLANGASFRGLSVVDNNVIWVGGSLGTVCQSKNGGTEFTCKIIPGFDAAEFRSVYAFDAATALICNIGTPAKILRTSNAGLSWEEVYSNENAAAFIDGIDFWNEKEGIVFGDPIDGMMLILTTNDGGQTWTELPEVNRPRLVEGEAGFAASGTTLRCIGDSRVVIATGGVASRLFISNDKGNSWSWVPTPILQGKSSTGIFSLSFQNNLRGVIVGGDYKNDSLSTDHIFLSNDGGNNWQQPSKPTRGYRECVEYISEKQLLAAGPSGIDISDNGGLSWESFSDEKKFHVVRKARNGNLVVIAGGDGKISLFQSKD